MKPSNPAPSPGTGQYTTSMRAIALSACLLPLACHPDPPTRQSSPTAPAEDTAVVEDSDEPADTGAEEQGDTGDPTAYEAALVIAGTFQMGCLEERDGDCRSDETLHVVTLTHDIEVDVIELTQREFQARMGHNPSSYGDCPDCPVENLTWHEAMAFANQRSDDDRLGRCYACTGSGGYTRCSPLDDNPYLCVGWRLPTEAEWEYAARCGEDHMYAGSDDLGEVAWTWDNSARRPAPGGGLAPNACGLMDMSGNVAEMVSDNYNSDYYLSSPDTNPPGPASDPSKVFRGGACVSDQDGARVALRTFTNDTSPNSFIGFRLVRSLL